MKIGIIGAGNLGMSFAKLFLRNGYANNLLLSDQNEHIIKNTVFWTSTTQDNIKESEILLITVKPNVIPSILDNIKLYGNHDKIIVSAAAGISIDSMEKKLDSELYPIVRCMTNLPISHGKGAIVSYYNKNVSDKHINKLKKIFAGPYLMEVNNEKLIDVSTVLIGSMPAFISQITQEHMQFGINNGFKIDEVLNLYLATLNGTAELLKNQSPDNIIKKVATPNGVTQKGLDIIEKYGLKKIINESLEISYEHVKSIKKNLD